jgi:glutathione-regulated potassium-efflux system ancillary protein KefF
MTKTVIFLAHQTLSKSRFNSALINKVKENAKDVMIRDLYQIYGNVNFATPLNVEDDKKIITEAGKIILQFPVQWYGMPAMMKGWIDAILEYGWAYATEKPALTGKTLAIAVTTGSPESDYSLKGSKKHFLKDFLINFEGTAEFCGMNFGGIFAVQGRGMTDEDLHKKAEQYLEFIQQ